MNRSLQIRASLVIVVLLLSIWALIPTIRLAMVSDEDRAAAVDDPQRAEQIAELEARAIRKGLDLQGGMYLVLEVDTEGMSNEQARDALQRVREIITNRVDQFGVSEPVIQTQGTTRIIVQLPGLQDPERAKRLIGQTAQLEFRLVRPMDDYQLAITKLDEAFRVSDVELEDAAVEAAEDDEADLPLESAETDTVETDTAESDTTANPFGDLPPFEDVATGLEREAELARERPFSAWVIYEPQLSSVGTPLYVEERNVNRVRVMIEAPEADVLLRDMEFQFGMATIEMADGTALRPLYLLNEQVSLAGDRLTGARTSPDPDFQAYWQVNFDLNRKGARQFSKVTGDNVGRQLAISLDGQVNSAPNIQSKIPGGQGVITGRFSAEEASDLALLLRAGALPTDVRFEEERTVGPSLGRDSIRLGVNAALYGSLLVVIFIILYYGRIGLVTVTALVSNIVILLAVLIQFGLVLTLPGIAGIILTVGMAVDANVLINERIREELRKDKTVRAAVQAGYANATRTIIDANVTTLIAAATLLWFGTGPILGFAWTLTIGILSSLFTSLVMTRVLMELITRSKGHQKISI